MAWGQEHRHTHTHTHVWHGNKNIDTRMTWEQEYAPDTLTRMFTCGCGLRVGMLTEWRHYRVTPLGCSVAQRKSLMLTTRPMYSNITHPPARKKINAPTALPLLSYCQNEGSNVTEIVACAPPAKLWPNIAGTRWVDMLALKTLWR